MLAIFVPWMTRETWMPLQLRRRPVANRVSSGSGGTPHHALAPVVMLVVLVVLLVLPALT